MILKILDLIVIREGKTILGGVNLEVENGVIHSILGINGSGKSSLAYAIMGCCGYRNPEKGSIIFRGKDITGLSLEERAKMGITLSWQEPARFEGLRVKDYLSLSAQQKNNQQNIEEALEILGLNPKDYLHRAVDKTLSGGERKRIELASVLLRRAQLTILDEPDSGIDMISLGDIVDFIKKLKEINSTVILITHRKEIAELADTASLLCFGRVVKNGSAQEVGNYFKTHCQKRGM